jgi:diacylglycerol kinase family enzyme
LTPVPVILNPTAGGGRLLRHQRKLSAAARREGVELEWWLTEQRGDGERLGRRAATEGHPLALAWGGDGTYNEVARGLLGSATAMGVLPGGSTSVLAYELGVPRPASRAIGPMLRGADRAMRVGRSDRDDLVLLMLSAGVDSVVVEEAFRRRRHNDGKTGIALQTLRELVRRRPLPRVRVRTASGVIEGGWAIVGNAGCYGGPLRATPGADPFAPGFEVVVQTAVGRPSAAAFALALGLGRHLRRRDVQRELTERVAIEPVAGGAQLPYQVDGDPIMALPVTLEVDPQPLLIRLPALG